MDERVEDFGFFWMEETNGQLSTPITKKRKVRPKKMEFLGWGSKPLIDFLQSIGKETSKELSRHEVTSIVNEYVKLNNLNHPVKKKRIMCDDRLNFLFGKKTMVRIKIYDLLESHFAENQDESEDGSLYSSEENEETVWKEKKASASDRKPQKKKVFESPKSCFAAIVSENIKLLYLKRSLVQELVKYPKTFEGKVVGSFVRIKSDPNDFSQKNSHQLLQVTGVKNASGVGDIGAEVYLQASNWIKDICISTLSDDNFTEEECEDLFQRVKAGSLKRPLVVEFEEKAQMLHEDITKHWLVREIALLRNLIDRANEKGWRRELFEYMERKKLLETPSEQSRLLAMVPKVTAEEIELPKVIAEEVEPEATKQDLLESERQKNSSPPQSILKGASENDVRGLEANGATENGNIKAPTEDQPVDFVLEPKRSFASIPYESIFTPYESSKEMHLQNSGDKRSMPEMPNGKVTETQVIELSDDDDDDANVNDKVKAWEGKNGHYQDHHGLESPIWYYLDPQGDIQGPFSMATLKRWSDADYFHPDFKVWRDGQSPEEAVLLREAIHQFFTIK